MRAGIAGSYIEWTQINTDATEEQRVGEFWCEAPPVGGHKGFWIIPDDKREGEATVVYVARAARRHRVGAVRKFGRGARLHWFARKGRYIDRGEFYAETHEDSPTGQMTKRGRGSHVRSDHD